MELFNKLLMMRQLNFQEGRIDLLNQRVFIAPGSMLKNLTEFMLKHPELIPEIYEHMRLSFDQGWAAPVKKTYGFKPKDFFRWLIDLSNVAGWGKSDLIELDDATSSGIFRTNNGIIADFFKGKSDEPVCHIWRGLASGGATALFEKDMDLIEVKCLAKGDLFCEFIFKPRTLMKNEKNLPLIKQLPFTNDRL